MNTSKNFSFESPFDMDTSIIAELSKIAKKFNKKYSTLVNWTKTEKEVMKTSTIGLTYPVTVCVYDITVKLPVVKWEGYEYVATLKKECGDEEQSQVFSARTEVKECFDAYFKKKFRCDHCQTNRFRKTVHLFRNPNGKELMIASTCSKEYFGIDVANKICNLFAFLSKGDIHGEFSNVFDKFWKKSNPFNKETFCKLCYGIISRDGHYVRGGGTTTEADHYMSLSLNLDSSIYIENLRNGIDKVLKLAEKFEYQKMVDYWKGKKNKDNFTNNVCVALEMYRPQHGYLAWAVFDYMKNVEGFGKAVEVSLNSNHVGEIGERITTEVKINNIRGMETSWGYTNLIEMIDKDGNILNWWTSKEFDAKKGDVVKIIGTIKEHGEFRGVKNTVIKNCKMEIVNVGTESGSCQN
jgi:hypothetical protein